MSDFTELATAGCLEAADRHAQAQADVSRAVRSLAEVLFWWRALDELPDAGKMVSDLSADLTAARPGLIWARNVSTHCALAVGRLTAELSYPLRYPLDYGMRVVWRPWKELPEPKTKDASWWEQQVQSYRDVLDGANTEQAVGLIRRWVSTLT